MAMAKRDFFSQLFCQRFMNFLCWCQMFGVLWDSEDEVRRGKHQLWRRKVDMTRETAKNKSARIVSKVFAELTVIKVLMVIFEAELWNSEPS